MKIIEVKTQEEFDSLPDSFEEETDIHILKGTRVNVKGDKKNGVVQAHVESYVFAFEGSYVSAFDGSDVYAHEGSSVTAFAGSDVKYLNPVI